MTATAPADPRVGLVLKTSYRIEARLGAGAFGAVYRATQLGLGKAVAVKLLMPEAFKTPGTVERFEREALLASKISHPVMAQVLDFGIEEVGGEKLPFLVMELVDGEELAEILAKYGPFSPSRAISIMRQLASLLSEVHGRGIVHRDLKPANLKLLRYAPGARQVHLKVLDFGIAKDVGSEAQQSLTATGSFVGTPRYMSPEQVKGQGVDARSDLYSCGVIFYELLTGDVPFRAASLAELIAKLLYDPVPPLPERFQEPLRGVVAQLLARDPAARFADAHAFDEALERCEAACRAPGFDDSPLGAPLSFGATAVGMAGAISMGTAGASGAGAAGAASAGAAGTPASSGQRPAEAFAATAASAAGAKVPAATSAGAVTGVGAAPRSRAVVWAGIGATLAVAAAALVVLKPWQSKDKAAGDKPAAAPVASAPRQSEPPVQPTAGSDPRPNSPAADPAPAQPPVAAPAPLPGASSQMGTPNPIPAQPPSPSPSSSPTSYSVTITNPNFGTGSAPAPAAVLAPGADPEALRDECERRLQTAESALMKAKLKRAVTLARALLADPLAQGDRPCANAGLRLMARKVECQALCKQPDIPGYKACMRSLQGEKGGKGNVYTPSGFVTTKADVVAHVQEVCTPFFAP